jgi:hypothetical protein
MNERTSGDSLRVRISTQEKAELESMVTIEGGNTTELLIEGIWRVIANRKLLLDQAMPASIRPRQPKDEALSVRLTTIETTQLTIIGAAERCPLSDLVGEGLWHVINDRKQDPQYQAGSERVLALLAELETARADLHQG